MGLRVNRPTEYIVTRKSIARRGAGLLILGSETSGSIRHVLATDLTGNGTGNALNIKSATTRGGTVEDIHFENIVMNNGGTFLQVNMNWNPTYSYSTLPEGYKADSLPPHWKKLLTKVEPVERGIPVFKDVYISNIQINGAKRAINAMGLEQSMIKNFHLKNVKVTAAVAGLIDYAQGWKFTNVKIVADDHSKLNVTHASDMDVKLED